MRSAIRHCLVTAFIILAPAAVTAKDVVPNFITHGPILGRLSSDGVGVWGRTARAGSFRVLYGLAPAQLNSSSPPVKTLLA